MNHFDHPISSLSYLKDVAGLRTVPVELGSRYTDHDWSQKLMTLADFIDNHVAPSSKVGVAVWVRCHRSIEPEVNVAVLRRLVVHTEL